MSCNRCATTAEAVAPASAGAAHIEAGWSENRDHPQQCDQCGAFLRADGGCTRCEGTGVSSDAHTVAMAAPSPTVAMAAAAAAADGETLHLTDHWRHEFAPAGRGGRDEMKLRNGDSLKSGERFNGPAYCVPKGKARRQATAGNYITPAVDQLADHTEQDGLVTVRLSDGGVAYYDLESRAACCDGDCQESHEGLCHHQMAAVIAGETFHRTPTGRQHDELVAQARLEFQGFQAGPGATPAVIRRSDAAYALLKEATPAIRVNARSLAETAQKAPPAPAPKKKKKKPKKPPAPAPAGRGNPQVQAVMQQIGVSPPLPTVADMQEQDPTLSGYRGFPVPIADPRYEVGEQEQDRLGHIMRRVDMSWQAARRRVEAAGGDPDDPAAYPASMEDRCWGLYGPPGTGKNSLARETAAALGLGYMEVDVRDRSDFQTLLCDTVIEADGKGGTRSTAKLGPVGQALVSGNVVALNEIVAADPDAQTALHQVLQDGLIRPPGPEGATRAWKVHPNSMIFLTWNPNVTRQDKPAPALLSRTPSLEMDYPSPQDETRRLATAMSDYLGETVEPAEIKRCVNLVRGLRELHTRGELESPPTWRELLSFTKSYYLNGQNRFQAGEMFRVLCSQAPGQKEDEWRQVQNLVDSFQEGMWTL